MNHLRADVIRRVVLVGFLLTFAAALLSVRNLALADSTIKPNLLCRLDLTKLRFPQIPHSGVERKVWLSPFKIDFQDDSTLVLSWVTADKPLPHLPKREKFSRRPVVPAHLHLLFVDAKKGTKIREKDLSVPSAPTSVFVNHSGNLIVRAGNSVKLYSADFALMNEAKFPLPIDFSRVDSASRIEISPDGRRLALCSKPGNTAKTELFDADRLRPLGGLLEPQKDCVQQVFLPHNGQLEPLPTIETANPSPASASSAKRFWPPMQPVIGDTIVVFRGSYMEFHAKDGKALTSDTLGTRQGFVPGGATARDSDLFAVVFARMRGLTVPGLDMYAFPSDEGIAVYDVRTAKRTFTVRVRGSSPWPPWRFVSSRCALSPNGTVLAVLSNSSLSFYRLP